MRTLLRGEGGSEWLRATGDTLGSCAAPPAGYHPSDPPAGHHPIHPSVPLGSCAAVDAANDAGEPPLGPGLG